MESDRYITCIKHADNDERYILNMHALHNAARLRRYLPRYLTVPRPIIANRPKWHIELATRLRVSQETKREATKMKAAATRQKNKEKNQQTTAGMVTDKAPTLKRRREEMEADNNSNDMDVE